MPSHLPIHFFTIVLNGEPFIRYHLDIFKQLPFKWHWHIVEGLAALRNDTAWSVQLGGHISDDLHRNARSKDGTTEYIDELARLYPNDITVYRKPEGVMWDGKLEMVNAPLENIQAECLLWQVDVDELWTLEQIEKTRSLFIEHPDRTAAFFRCWYFVGENLIISNRDCFTQHPNEWLRAWRFQPGAVWSAHEPPTLVQPVTHEAGLKWQSISTINPFLEEETESVGLIFQHCSYVTPEQLEFKERYYGYSDIVARWYELQSQQRFPVLLRQYFHWVADSAMVDTADAYGIVPIAQKQPDGLWKFEPSQQPPVQISRTLKPPKIVIDGVIFQDGKTGIAKVWKLLLEEWVNQGLGKHLVVLDRQGMAAAVPGIHYHLFPPFTRSNLHADQALIQQVCDEENAALFVSTHHTTPLTTPSIFLAHDLILDVAGAVSSLPEWQNKQHCIEFASAFVAVSETTAQDLIRFFPSTASKPVVVAPCGVSKSLSPANAEEIAQFRIRYGITKPYFVLTAVHQNLKDELIFFPSAGETILPVKMDAHQSVKDELTFFQSFARLCSRLGFEVLCTGTLQSLEPELRVHTSGSTVHLLDLDESELRIAYSGAIALVYSCKKDGLGLPVREAMACGCPVITSPIPYMQEIAGDAVLYVPPGDSDQMVDALCEIQKPTVRQTLIQKGLLRSQQFSSAVMADKIRLVLLETTLRSLRLRSINLIVFPDWQQPEELLLADLQIAMKAALTHPTPQQVTLLIVAEGIDAEAANFALSDVAMHLLLEEALSLEAAPEISLITEFSPLQWEVLLPHLQGRIPLQYEDKSAIAQAQAGAIATVEV